jgi:hypothetical protein
MMQDDSDWTEDERRALDSFGANETPSDLLRARTMHALRERELVAVVPRPRSTLRPALGVAATIAIVVGATAYVATRAKASGGTASARIDTAQAPPTSVARTERHVIWY